MSVITELSNVYIPIIEDLCLDLAHAKNVIADLMRSEDSNATLQACIVSALEEENTRLKNELSADRLTWHEPSEQPERWPVLVEFETNIFVVFHSPWSGDFTRWAYIPEVSHE